jgi:hypothetical protein
LTNGAKYRQIDSKGNESAWKQQEDAGFDIGRILPCTEGAPAWECFWALSPGRHAIGGMGFIHGIPHFWVINWIERGIDTGYIFDDEAENIITWVRALDNKYMDYSGKKISTPKGSGTMR